MKILVLAKIVSDYIGVFGKIIGAIAAAATALCWYGVSVGSWQNKDQGCIEFDLRPTVEGLLYAPNADVVTKYEGGFTILNWVSFRYFTERNGSRAAAGISTGWLNPLSGTLSLGYTEQEVNGRLHKGYLQKIPLVFEYSSQECSRR